MKNRDRSVDALLDEVTFLAEVSQLGDSLKESRARVQRLSEATAGDRIEDIPPLVAKCYALLSTGYEFGGILRLPHPLPWKRFYEISRPDIDSWIALSNDGKLYRVWDAAFLLLFTFFLTFFFALSLFLLLLGADGGIELTMFTGGLFALFWGLYAFCTLRPFRPTAEVPAGRIAEALSYHVARGLQWAREEQLQLEEAQNLFLERSNHA